MKKLLKNRKFNFVLIIFLTAVVLYFSLKDNFFEIVNQIKNLNLLWLMVAIILLLGYWIFSSIAMKLITDNFKKNVKIGKIFRINVITQFFNGITPSSSGGQPYQIYALKKEGLTFVDSTNVSIQTFVCYQTALVLLGIIAIIFNKIFHLFSQLNFLKILVIIGFAVNILVAVFLFLITIAKKFNKKIIKVIINIGAKLKIIKDKEKSTEKMNQSIDEFQKGTYLLLKNKKVLILAIICQFLGLISLYSIPVALLFGMNDYSINLGLSIVTTAYVMVSAALIPLPGGTGGLEYAFICFFGNFIAGSKLSALMITWRFITYYLGVIIGGLILSIGKKEDNNGKQKNNSSES